MPDAQPLFPNAKPSGYYDILAAASEDSLESLPEPSPPVTPAGKLSPRKPPATKPQPLPFAPLAIATASVTQPSVRGASVNHLLQATKLGLSTLLQQSQSPLALPPPTPGVPTRASLPAAQPPELAPGLPIQPSTQPASPLQQRYHKTSPEQSVTTPVLPDSPPQKLPPKRHKPQPNTSPKHSKAQPLAHPTPTPDRGNHSPLAALLQQHFPGLTLEMLTNLQGQTPKSSPPAPAPAIPPLASHNQHLSNLHQGPPLPHHASTPPPTPSI